MLQRYTCSTLPDVHLKGPSAATLHMQSKCTQGYFVLTLKPKHHLSPYF